MKLSMQAYEVVTALLVDHIKAIEKSMKTSHGDDYNIEKDALEQHENALQEIEQIGTY